MDRLSAKEIQDQLSSGKYIPASTKKKLQARLEQLQSSDLGKNSESSARQLETSVPSTQRVQTRADPSWHKPKTYGTDNEQQNYEIKPQVKAKTKFADDLTDQDLFPDLEPRMCLTKSAPNVHAITTSCEISASNYRDMLSKSTNDIGSEIELHLEYSHIMEHINMCSLDKFILKMILDDSDPNCKHIYAIDKLICVLTKYIYHVADLCSDRPGQNTLQGSTSAESEEELINGREHFDDHSNKYFQIVYSETNLRQDIVTELKEIWHADSVQIILCDTTYEKINFEILSTKTLDALSEILLHYKLQLSAKLARFMTELGKIIPDDDHYTYHFNFELDPESKIGLTRKIRSVNGVVRSTYHDILIDRVASFTCVSDIQHRICESVSSSQSTDNLVIISSSESAMIYVTYTLPLLDKNVRLKINNCPQGSNLLFGM
jgi:hypothetical protein